MTAFSGNGTSNNRWLSNWHFLAFIYNILYQPPYIPHLLNYLLIWVKNVTYFYEPYARIRWTYFLQNGGSFSSAIESISQEQRDCFTHESRSVLFRTYSCFRLTLLHVASYLGSMSTVSIRILTFRPHLRSQGSSVHSRPTLRLTGKLIKA